MKRTPAVILATVWLGLYGCQNHPVDCAAGFGWYDCLPGTKGYENRMAARERIEQQCSSYGFRKGTDAYSRCLMTVDQNNQSRSLAVIGAFRPASSQPYFIPAPKASRSVTTNCVRTGTMMNCVSN